MMSILLSRESVGRNTLIILVSIVALRFGSLKCRKIVIKESLVAALFCLLFSLDPLFLKNIFQKTGVVS